MSIQFFRKIIQQSGRNIVLATTTTVIAQTLFCARNAMTPPKQQGKLQENSFDFSPANFPPKR